MPRARRSVCGGDQDRARAGKGVENDAVTFRAILQCIRNQSDWLDRGVHFELLATSTAHRADPVVPPYIRAVTAVLTKLKNVDVRARCRISRRRLARAGSDRSSPFRHWSWPRQ